MVIVIICALYLVLQVGRGEAWIVGLVLFALMMVLGFVIVSKPKKIQEFSVSGKTEEMERLYRQGMKYVWASFMIFLIVTSALMYYFAG